MIRFKFLFIPLFLLSRMSFFTPMVSGADVSDTLLLKKGECDTIRIHHEKQGSLIWSSGNQDVANVDVLWGNGIICGIQEGQTYISANSVNGKFQYKFIVRVLPGNQIVRKRPVTEYRPNIDGDIEKILNEITDQKSPAAIDSKLSVSGNKRYLIYKDSGQPFIFLSETLWSMARRLDREEIVEVLDISKEEGFTAVQFIAHSHYMGPNVYGDSPFEDENFLRPSITPGSDPGDTVQYDYWDHVEFIIKECVKRKLFICLLPSWREQWNQKHNLDEHNAFAYGKFIGKRFRKYNPWIIWVMGGDEAPDTPRKILLHRELAKGIAWGINGSEDYSNSMMTYHTYGPSSTIDFFPEDEPFMDFNTIQSGHSLQNLEGMIERSYKAQRKPVVDFEPFYDKNGRNLNETRVTIYWGIFAGGFGTSYGSWNLWHCGARNDLAAFRIPDSFLQGFGTQIQYLGKLLSSHDMLVRMPDQTILIGNETKGLDRILACRASDGSYALIYSPNGESFEVDLSCIDGQEAGWYWFNPRNGETSNKELLLKKSATHVFTPPTSGGRFSGNDWVLVLERARLPGI